MPIKETDTIRKFEYESPDGDSSRITYLESKNRKYVEIQRLKEDGSPDGDAIVWDYDMLMDISDTLRSVNRKPAVPNQSYPSFSPFLSLPKVTDHREGMSDNIQRSVQESMNHFDEGVQAIESFDPDREAWHQNATGINLGSASMDEVPDEVSAGDTPEEFSISGVPAENMSKWQKEATQRMSGPRQVDQSRRIKKVSAQDLI